jgi:hypothetical protein
MNALIKPVFQEKIFRKHFTFHPHASAPILDSQQSACLGSLPLVQVYAICAFNRYTTTHHATIIRFSLLSMSKNCCATLVLFVFLQIVKIRKDKSMHYFLQIVKFRIKIPPNFSPNSPVEPN